jgi:hypothetical protein
MAPSRIVKVSGGPPNLQPVKSVPLKRLVKSGSTSWMSGAATTGSRNPGNRDGDADDDYPRHGHGSSFDLSGR